MKKGDIVEGIVERIDFPNKGIVRIDTEDGTEYAVVKNALPGQRVSFRISKKKHGAIEGRLLAVTEESVFVREEGCPHAGICGGCLYQGMSYEKQLMIKDGQVRRLLSPVIGEETYDAVDEGILPSPRSEGYRNKMELTFGDNEPGGELQLGMHVRGSFYDIVTTEACRIMDADMLKVLRHTLQYFRERSITYYHKRTHEGYLRHLLLRKAAKTGELLICLVTSSEPSRRREAVGKETVGGEDELLAGWIAALLEAHYAGTIAGILHTRNDRPADVVEDQGTTVLYGQGYFTEELLGLHFRITPFSFFQTNSLGAEVLYERARDYILRAKEDYSRDSSDDGIASGGNGGNTEELPDNEPENEEAIVPGKERKRLGRVFDLYSGTGTIAQILSPAADEVIGVEIVEEAVEAAKKNAADNGLSKCRFLCGDVLKVIDEIKQKPDMIVLDPPRDGIHPKALPKLIAYGVEHILYISCKPTSLARDLPAFLATGYRVIRLCKVDMFPMTGGVEACVLLSKLSEAKHHINVKVDMDELDLTSAEAKATYKEIEEWVQEHYGFHVTNLNIAQVKQKHGIIERENYNKPKSEDSRQPGCPEEKVKAIEAAMRHFQMI